MGTVSIIVPVHYAQNTIKETVSSILAQSYRDLEIILVDDGSKDESLVVMKTMEEAGYRIRVFSHENQGVSLIRNYVISVSSGKYTFFSDADDLLPVDAIKNLVELAEKENVSVVIGMVNTPNKATEHTRIITGEMVAEIVLDYENAFESNSLKTVMRL